MITGAYWKRKLEEVTRELDAATRISDVDAASARLMRAKEQLKWLQDECAEKPKRQSNRGSRSAVAS